MFEENLLRYLLQNNRAVNYLPYLGVDLFDYAGSKVMFDIIQKYRQQYKSKPDRVNLERFILNQGLEASTTAQIIGMFDTYYEPLEDIAIVEEHMTTHIKKQMFANAMKEGLSMLEEADMKDISKFYQRIGKIDNLDFHNTTGGSFLIQDFFKYEGTQFDALPVFLDSWNQLTSNRGFGTPELVVIVGRPKSFKTGLMIITALGLIQDGHDIAYYDWENGRVKIKDRFKQAMIHTEKSKFYEEDTMTLLGRMHSTYKKIIGAGDVYIEGLTKKKHTLHDIQTSLEEKCNQGFEPRAIFYDYLDIAGVTNRQASRREQIQEAYYNADGINKTFNTFCMTVSKMKQEFWNREDVGPDCVAEDSEKVYNAHAAFALVRTDDMMSSNYGELVPLAQREGTTDVSKSVPLRIVEEKMFIEEVAYEQTDNDI